MSDLNKKKASAFGALMQANSIVCEAKLQGAGSPRRLSSDEFRTIDRALIHALEFIREYEAERSRQWAAESAHLDKMWEQFSSEDDQLAQMEAGLL